MAESARAGSEVARRWTRSAHLHEFLRVALWFWPFGDRSADWAIVRRLIVIVSVGAGLIGGSWILVSKLQHLRFQRQILESTTQTASNGIAMNIAVMDYASAAFLAEAHRTTSGVLAVQVTDRYGFLVYGPEQIDLTSYPSHATLVERALVDAGGGPGGTAETVGLLRQVVEEPTVQGILIDVLWKGLAAALLFGSAVALTMQVYKHRFVIAPLEHFIDAVARTSQTGKYVRVEYLSETSFGIFARNFNLMQDRLERQDLEQQALLDQNGRINSDLWEAYGRIRQDQRVKLAQFEALGRVLDQAEILITYADAAGRPVFTNLRSHPLPAIAEVMRQTGFDGQEIFHKLTAAGLSCQFVSTGSPGREDAHDGFAIEVASPDGRAWVLVAGPNDIEGQVILCTHISKLREMEQRLRQTQKMEALGRLVGGVAHEFNNMLSIISGNLDLLEMAAAGKDPMQSDSLAAARRAAERAAATVSQLLAFTLRKVLNRRRIEITPHFTGLTGMLRGVLGPGISLQVSIEPGIVIDCDPDQLDGAVINLATNARDAMERSGMLYLRVFRRGEWQVGDNGQIWQDFCVIEVEDTGPGVPRDLWHKIFDPFFSTKAASGKGVGLGLAAVSGFVEAFGGRVEVQSGASGGALFVLRLPAGCDRQADTPTLRPPVFAAAGMAALVVEDEADVQRIAVLFLQRCGFACDTAATLEEARQALSDQPSDHYRLLVCDLQLPDGNGADFLPAFRTTNPAARIICASGYSDATLIEQLDGLVFLGKPYSFATLNETVARLFAAPG